MRKQTRRLTAAMSSKIQIWWKQQGWSKSIMASEQMTAYRKVKIIWGSSRDGLEKIRELQENLSIDSRESHCWIRRLWGSRKPSVVGHLQACWIGRSPFVIHKGAGELTRTGPGKAVLRIIRGVQLTREVARMHHYFGMIGTFVKSSDLSIRPPQL